MGRTNVTAPVNKIIPFSAVDGFGNRTAIFLQGCNQNCRYCHNPETIRHCTACGACVEACPVGALRLVEEPVGADGGKAEDRADEKRAGRKRYVAYDISKCCNCDTCIKVCKENASPRIRNMTAEEVMEEILPYFPFIDGITTSGGECTLHLDFLTELYRMVKREGKTTYADTNGQIPLWDKEAFLQTTDRTMIDLKAGTEEDHRKLTGMGLENPVENIKRLAEFGKIYEIRTVVVPEVVDNRRTVELGSSLIAAYPEVRYRLIQYRPFGVREEYLNIRMPSDQEMEELCHLARRMGVKEVIIT